MFNFLCISLSVPSQDQGLKLFIGCLVHCIMITISFLSHWSPSPSLTLYSEVTVVVCCVLCYCSKVQARFAFASYLARVQQRLMNETTGGEAGSDNEQITQANEQMVCIHHIYY